METSTLGLRFKVKEKHFRSSGDLKLKCTATIATIYWKSNEESVQGVQSQSALVSESRSSRNSGKTHLQVQSFNACFIFFFAWCEIMIFVKSTIKNARLSTIAMPTWLQNQIHKLTFIRWNGFILPPKGLHSKWFVYTTLDVICYVITQADKMYYFTLTPFTNPFIIFWLSIFISKYYSILNELTAVKLHKSYSYP